MSQASPFSAIRPSNTSKFYEEVFPNEFIEDDMIIRPDGNISIGFYLELPLKESLSAARLDEINMAIADVFANVPKGTVIHKQDQYFWAENDLSRTNLSSAGFISSKRVDFFRDRPALKSRHLLYVCYDYTKGKQRTSASTFFSGGFVTNPLSKVDRNRSRVRQDALAFTSRFNSIPGVQITRMNSNQLVDEKHRYFSLKFAKSQPAFGADLHNKGNEVVVGDKKARFVFLKESGDKVWSSGYNDRGVVSFMPWTMGHYLPFPHVVNQSFRILDSEAELKRLDSRRKLIKSLSTDRGPEQDHHMLTRNIEAFTAEIRQTNSSLTRLGHNVMIWDNSEQTLELNSELVKTAYMRMNSSIALTDSFNAANYFFAFSPGMALDTFDTLLVPTELAVCFGDWSRPQDTDKNGIAICNRELEPILIDFWHPKLSNRNSIVVAPPGGGKSFFANDILAQEYEQGVDITIIDVGDPQHGSSYKNIIDFYGGKIIEYNPDRPLSANPFLIGKDQGGSYRLTEDKLVFLTSLLTLIWRGTDQQLTKEEDSIVTSLLQAYYLEVNKESSQKPRLDGFVKFVERYTEENKNNESFQKEFRYFDVNSFLLVFKKFITGQYAKVLNSDDNESISQHRLIAFDLVGIAKNKDLYPIVALLIVELVLDKLRSNPKTKKRILLDEAWSMLSGNLAPFIENLYRTIRKSNGAVTIVTQSIIELATSAVGGAIKASAATKIILDHSSQKALVPDLSKFLGFTDSEIEMIHSIRKGDGFRDVFIKREDTAGLYSVMVGPHAYYTFSSWSDDRKDIADLVKKGGSAEYAINQMVENKLSLQ